MSRGTMPPRKEGHKQHTTSYCTGSWDESISPLEWGPHYVPVDERGGGMNGFTEECPDLIEAQNEAWRNPERDPFFCFGVLPECSKCSFSW